MVTETLPLLLVAGDALGEAQAHVLQPDQTVDAGRRIEDGAAAVADLGQVGFARLEVGVAASGTALHRVGGEPVGVLDGVRSEVEVDLVHPVARALVVDQRAGPNSEMARKRGREMNSSRPLRRRRPGT